MSTNRPIKEIFGDRHLWPECISIGKPHIVYCLHCIAGIVRLSFRFLCAWSFAKPTSSRKWKTTFALPSSRWTSASTPFGALCETEWNESNKKKVNTIGVLFSCHVKDLKLEPPGLVCVQTEWRWGASEECFTLAPLPWDMKGALG